VHNFSDILILHFEIFTFIRLLLLGCKLNSKCRGVVVRTSLCTSFINSSTVLPSSGHCATLVTWLSSYLPVSMNVYLIRYAVYFIWYDAVYFSRLFSSFSSYFWTGLIGWIQRSSQSIQAGVCYFGLQSSSQTKKLLRYAFFNVI
jgi:hypothetical protein